MDDCYSDMDEPLYGFRSKIVLTENSPCELGVTCRGVPEDLNPDLQSSLQQQQQLNSQYYVGSSMQLQQQQQNAQYYESSSLQQQQQNVQYFDNSIERQTGEDFSSDGPPDCRVTFDPSQCRRL
jgi:hypothetical protein